MDYLIQIVDMLVENHEDQKESIILSIISDKIKTYQDYRIGVQLSAEKKRRIIDLTNEGRKIALEYAKYAGDMGMIDEYDRLKKEAAAVYDALGDIEGQLRADMEIAKKQLDVILDRIKEDLLDQELAKSNAEAERKARVDPRYEAALEDYRDFCKMGYVIKNKLKSLADIHDDIRQSVSTARNSIIREGYNS